MECSICAENFNNTRKQVECPNCNETCCNNCFKKYILDSKDLNPLCMFCDKKLAHMFVRENTPIAWANSKYIKNRSQILLQHQKNLLPETQKFAAAELDRRKRVEQYNLINDKISDLYREIYKLNNEKYKLNISKTIIKEDIITRRRCCNHSCNGFLNNKWYCNICEKLTCDQCGEEKIENHVCNEEAKSSFVLINNECRPCPKCGIMIYKIVGCNQMFCTQCHCMFDFRTGREEKGLFHNPHYFEAIANGTINLDNDRDRCGDEIGVYSLVAKIKRFVVIKNLDDNLESKFLSFNDLLIMVYHIQDVTFMRYSNPDNDEYKELRIKYILKEISEEYFLKEIISKEKKREKNEEITYLLELFVNVCRDIIFNVYDILKLCKQTNYKDSEVTVNDKKINVLDYLISSHEEAKVITKFCNQKFNCVSKHFKNVAPKIDDSWKILNSSHI